jgi:dynein heavy chain
LFLFPLHQDYLETKRIAFPRFYFVAPADLLDILSKGSNPQLILRHLPKCFDNVHNLTFKKSDAGVSGEHDESCLASPT